MPTEALWDAEYDRACAYAQMSEHTSAEKHLRLAIELGYRDAEWLEQDADFDSCREEPWFQTVLRGLREGGEEVGDTGGGGD